MWPSRLVVCEARAEECLDLLLALNAGLPGMASLLANYSPSGVASSNSSL